ncbi:MAG: Uma2 family endonuclease [Arcicella sp.]|nr:Uma2 family endonuclease [Arcicella sp.]
MSSLPQIQRDILASPHAFIVLQRLQDALEKEKELRKHFYEIVEENRKMEFINGEIYFHSPVKLKHNEANGRIYRLLAGFVDENDLGLVGIEKLLISLTRNDYEPDVCFWKQSRAKDFTEDQMQFPAPDLVVEVLSKSTENTDRTTKYEDYEAHGVKEYWIIDPSKQTIEQYILSHKKYELVFKGKDGNIESVAVKNFKIPVKSIFDKRLTNKVLNDILK